MTTIRKAPWDSLSPEMKHVGAGLAAAWRSRRARQIEAGSPASSPKVSDDEDDTMMETGSDDSASAPAPPVHAGFTMEQAQTHYDATVAEVQPAPTPLSAFQRAQG